MGCSQGAKGRLEEGTVATPKSTSFSSRAAPQPEPDPEALTAEELKLEPDPESLAFLDKIAVKALWVTDASTPGKVEDFYELGEELGKGAYGCVFRATSRATGEPRAVKRIAKSGASTMERGIKKIKVEIDLMLALDHPGILRLHETFEDRKTVCLVLELCRGPSLQQALVTRGEGLPEDEAVLLMKQLLECVRYLHENLVCHRDIKPENLLFGEPFPEEERFPATGMKLADFGLACRFPRPAVGPGSVSPALRHRELPLTEKVGTPAFVAPEVFTGHYDQLCDLYSCGIIMHLMLTAVHPFLDAGTAECGAQEHPAAGPEDAVPIFESDCGEGPLEELTPEARSLIFRLLAPRPHERLSAARALLHMWLAIEHVNSAHVSLVELPSSSLGCCSPGARLDEGSGAAAASPRAPNAGCPLWLFPLSACCGTE
eukprot:CAMPEP_0203878202 /NCGR_PEP_ID=MMETSP0359-20131031/22756_1 /ASSEMBLY_ACC=CAM_ASM_000338 /TAXON_ID=268821 /ORGANISM="Scrippsiella Hangoei, Strain SHTV-5" /LENGTH=430 /DNA_ID=CAMNT_0050797323 /DNA_START=37 /DNA_END=1329 /DNA_ORIENTATION=+